MAGVGCYNGTITSGAGAEIINAEQRERLDDEVQAEARKHLVTIEPAFDGRMKDIA